MKIIPMCLALIIPIMVSGQTQDSVSVSDTYLNESETNDDNQHHVYKVNAALEIPLTVGLAALTGYGFKELTGKNGSTVELINALNYEQDVAAINRWTDTPQFSTKASKHSDYIFYGSFALGIAPLLDGKINDDYGRILLMYVEALSITGSIYSMTAANVDKYRPLAYSSEASMEERLEDDSKNSFPGGHPALTATASFFIAKVFSDYYPHRKGLKISLYTGAAALTLTNAYLRWKAGKHFPTDLAVGIGYGTLVGILIPELHKINDMNAALSVTPYPGGMSLAYKIR